MRASDQVLSRTDPNGDTVLLNRTTGQWHTLNSTASVLWRVWRAGGSFEQGVAAIAQRHPAVAPARIRDEAGTLLDLMIARGLLTIELPERAADAAMAAPPHSTAGARAREVVLAFTCLLVAAVAARLPFRVTHRLVRLTRTWCARPVAPERARRIVAAVHTSARWYPARAACLELSLAAVMMAAVRGLRLDWCLGSTARPYRFHAWVETDGVLVPDPGIPVDQAAYQRVLTV